MTFYTNVHVVQLYVMYKSPTFDNCLQHLITLSMWIILVDFHQSFEKCIILTPDIWIWIQPQTSLQVRITSSRAA